MKKQPSSLVRKQIRTARKALQDFQKAIEPLYLRTGEGDYQSPSTVAAVKALDELSLRLAAGGGLGYTLNSLKMIAKKEGFPSWQAMLEYHDCHDGDDRGWITRAIAKLTGREIFDSGEEKDAGISTADAVVLQQAIQNVVNTLEPAVAERLRKFVPSVTEAQKKSFKYAPAAADDFLLKLGAESINSTPERDAALKALREVLIYLEDREDECSVA